MSDGIRRRHSAGCPALERPPRRCRCAAGWEAAVYDDAGNKVRRSFPTRAAALAWRSDALSARSRGGFRAPSKRTVREAGDDLIDGMGSGRVRTRSGDRYKPSVIRGYAQALRLRIYPELGGARLSDVKRRDVQRIADAMLAKGADPSTIRNAILPLRVVYRRGLEDGDVLVNPCERLRLPAVRGRRERIASPEEAEALLAAVPGKRDRAALATAFYAGLRLGELRALRWEDVDLATGTIRVERSLDHTGATVAPKSRAGRRTVPIVAALRDVLVELRLDGEDGYVFGERGRPFTSSTLYDRLQRAWEAENARRREAERDDLLEPIGLHEARHTFA